MIPAAAQEQQPCNGLLGRLNTMLDRYHAAAETAISDGTEPAKALDLARAKTLKGDVEATVTMVGIPLLLHGRRDVLRVSMIRQVCTYGTRNALPLHVATCAYLTALNPLGDRDDKRRAVEAEIARFEGLAPEKQAEFGPAIATLKACLPRA